MRILITGGAGFIGSHLVHRLIDKNEIIVLDDFSMGKRENLPSTKNKKLVIFGGSIMDDVDYLFENIDTVFHLAALTRPRESFTNPIITNEINVEGTLRTFMNCQEHGVKNLIFVSSASVYGYQEKYPFVETAKFNPESPYAATKVMGEMYCQLFAKKGSMRVNRVRPFNVYGERQDPNGPYAAAVSKFIDSLNRDGKPFITGDGKQFRDFIYVEDVVDLMIEILKFDINGEVFNAGSGKKTSINALYNTIGELMKKKVEPNYIDPVNDPNTLASIEKAEKMLHWRPKHSLIEGLIKTIERTK